MPCYFKILTVTVPLILYIFYIVFYIVIIFLSYHMVSIIVVVFNGCMIAHEVGIKHSLFLIISQLLDTWVVFDCSLV